MFGLPRLAWWHATVAGMVVGAVYTVSPTTVWFLLLLPALFAWARRDLGPRERRWVLGLLGVAVAARLVALCGFLVSADQFKEPYAVLIGDERYIVNRSLWMVHTALGHRLAPFDYQDVFGTYGQSGLQSLLAYWQLWFGPAPYGAHLINVAIWLAGAVVLHRTARRAFGPLAALSGFAVLLFMPTLFVWSISALKEPAYFLLTALTLAGAMAVVRARRAGARVAASLLVVGAVAAISTLRSIALAVTAGGLVLAAAGGLATRRARVCAIALVLAVLGGGWALRQPVVEARLMHEFRRAAISHLGNVNTPGYGYWLLDPHFYTRPEDDSLSYMVPAEAARFAVRAAVSFVTVPLPWDMASRSALALLPEQLAWYVLAALAGVGVVAGWRRDAAFTWLLVGNALVGAAAVAIYSGNVGTLVRLRDTVVPVIAWLGALGGCVAFEWALRRSSEGTVHGLP